MSHLLGAEWKGQQADSKQYGSYQTDIFSIEHHKILLLFEIGFGNESFAVYSILVECVWTTL
jgi:hypothetical protein